MPEGYYYWIFTARCKQGAWRQ